MHRFVQPWPAKGRGVLDAVQEGFGTAWLTVRSLAAVPVKKPIVAGFELERSVTPVSQATPGSWTAGDVYRVRLVINARTPTTWAVRSEEHKSELQSLIRTSYDVFCLKKKKQTISHDTTTQQ